MSAKTSCAICFWVVVIMVSMFFIVWQLVTMLQHYLSYPKEGKFDLLYRQSLPFPGVTVCNSQFLDISAVHWLKYGDASLKEESLWTDAYDSFLSKANAFGSAYVLTKIREGKTEEQAMAEMRETVFSQQTLTENIGIELSKIGAVNLTDFIISCRFMGKRCDISSAFQLYFDPEYYNCFTFMPNSDITTTGSAQGLQLAVFLGNMGKINQAASGSTADSNLLKAMLAKQRNARIVVHEPNTQPKPNSEGLDVSPGFSAKLGLVTQEYVRLPAPYGICETGEDDDDDYQYTPYTCWNECSIERCSCIDARFPLLSTDKTMPFCLELPNIKVGECSENLTDSCLSMIKNWNSQKDCSNDVHENMNDCQLDCNKMPCKETTYAPTYSSGMTAIPESTDDQGVFYDDLQKFISQLSNVKKEILMKEYGNNFSDSMGHYIAYVNVYLDDLSVRKMEETKAYDTSTFLADIGRSVVLWAALCILAMFMIFRECKRGKMKWDK